MYTLKAKVERIELDGDVVISTARFEPNNIVSKFESIRLLGDLGIGTVVTVTLDIASKTGKYSDFEDYKKATTK